jgi:hypothetical protein
LKKYGFGWLYKDFFFTCGNTFGHILYNWIFTRSLIIFKIYEIHVVINYFPNRQIHENFLSYDRDDMCITARWINCVTLFTNAMTSCLRFCYSDWPLNHAGGDNVKLVYCSCWSGYHFLLGKGSNSHKKIVLLIILESNREYAKYLLNMIQRTTWSDRTDEYNRNLFLWLCRRNCISSKVAGV